MAEDSDAEKTEEPSSHRIEEFRKRGEVASSREFANVLILAACIGALSLSMVYIYQTFSEYIEWLYRLNMAEAFTEVSRKTILTKTMVTLLKCVAPVFVTAFLVGIISNVIQFGFLFAPDVLELKLDRIDPMQGFKRIFSVRSLVEALKGIFKFILVTATVYWFLHNDLQTYRGFMHMDLFHSFLHGQDILVKLSFAMLVSLAVIAIGDFAYQKISYMNRLKMTKEEAKQEFKEQEGNPEIRQKIKSIQREMARKRMVKEVKAADVIVTNPTHLSIALRYDAETMISPKVVAKGSDFLALKIREIAKENNIPIVENVPLARTLYKTVKEGSDVPRTMYKAVAEVLAFVYKLKRKEKALK